MTDERAKWESILAAKWTRAGRPAREALILAALGDDTIGQTELEDRIKAQLSTPDTANTTTYGFNVYAHLMLLVAAGRVHRERRPVGGYVRWFYSRPPGALVGPIVDLENMFHEGDR